MKLLATTFIMLITSFAAQSQNFIEGSWNSVDENKISRSFVFNKDGTGNYLRGKSSFPIMTYSLKKVDKQYAIDFIMGDASDKTPMYSIIEKVSASKIRLIIYMDKKERDDAFGSALNNPINLSKN